MTSEMMNTSVEEDVEVEQEPVDQSLSANEQRSAQAVNEKGQPAEAETIENLQEQIEKYKDRWLRAEAEVENVRKRVERRTRDRVASERERLLRAFLNVADNLERALDSEAADEGLRDGVALTHRELLRFLSTEDVSPMQEVVGQFFDPLYHEAVAITPPSDEQEDGEIVEQIQRGYLLDDRPLRPARVVVARSTDE